ncbi:hypothetical protein BJF79_25315 [Actinomadura sp. CNU-125]|nr:hypothetical protein BJF79_25315 [Actinomadura sp. CNU-125]
MSQSRAANRVGMTASYISQIESGKKRCKRSLVEALDPEFKAGGVLLNLYDDLNGEGTLGVPTWFDWPEVEAEAELLVTWQPNIVPGLLQTEDYARTLLGAEETLRARMARQEIIMRDTPPPVSMIALLSDHVLNNIVGSRKIMQAQLEHLLTMGSLPNVTIQVVLNEEGVPAGQGGSFVLATMKDRSEIAYLETAVRGITTDEPRDIVGLARTLDALRGSALPTSMSRNVIRKTLEETWT